MEDAVSRVKFSLVVLASLFIAGCSIGLLPKHHPKSLRMSQRTQPPTLSQYIRAIYKVSGENSREEAHRRETLLNQSPRLAALCERVSKNAADREPALQLASSYL